MNDKLGIVLMLAVMAALWVAVMGSLLYVAARIVRYAWGE